MESDRLPPITSSQALVLVVTNSRDVTADYLAQRLTTRSIPFVRLDTDDIPQRARVGLALIERPVATLHRGVETVDLSRVTAVWWRRPELPVLPPEAPDRFRSYLTNEAATALGGILRSCDALWVNHPEANSLAEYKPYQLTVAARLGLAVPRTLITSCPSEAREFIDELGDAPVIKAIDQGFIEMPDGRGFVAYSRQINERDLGDPGAVRVCPVLLQERIPKGEDIRVTVVGNKAFATAITPRRGSGALDWREMAEEELCYRPTQLPSSVERQCVQLLREMTLQFAAIDMVRAKDGQLYFLEINPNGQWAWIEMRTGQPIADALATMLEGGEEHGPHAR